MTVPENHNPLHMYTLFPEGRPGALLASRTVSEGRPTWTMRPWTGTGERIGEPRRGMDDA
ncbi:hypothetical protein RR48_08044 [Papilio machaon]|uniref:Uncharacterized protein n=1 Tax=Papilio machaon TaxID=76193 RepID=A0A194R1S7_PAPMA|nr:hypothetical protein RR48_08044 [Papilio machaon]